MANMSKIDAFGHQNVNITELETIAKDKPIEFMGVVREAIKSGDLSFNSIPGERLDRFYNALDFPVKFEVTDKKGNKNTITTQAFTPIATALVQDVVVQGFTDVPDISADLVTEMQADFVPNEIGIINLEDKDVDEVPEGGEFPQINMNAKRFGFRQKKNGRIISITKESQKASVINAAQELGKWIANYIIETTIDFVTDRYGSLTTSAHEPYVLRPTFPTSTALGLYTASAHSLGGCASGNRVTSNALADDTDLKAAKDRLLTMTALTDGRKLNFPPFVGAAGFTLLIPEALRDTAWKIINTEYIPGVSDYLSAWGPRGMYQPKLIAHPRLDTICPSTWYLGFPKEQFKRIIVAQTELVSAGSESPDYLKREVIAQTRVSTRFGVNATDWRYFIQNLTASSYPA